MKIGRFDLLLLALGAAGWGYLFDPGWVKIESVNLKLKCLHSVFSGIELPKSATFTWAGG